MQNPLLVTNHVHRVHEIFRVYEKGKLIAVGTATDLQTLFNERAHTLKRRLRELVSQPDEAQIGNRYQIITQAEHNQDVQNERAHIRNLESDARTNYIWPEDISEHELMFNPGNEQLRQSIKRKKHKYHRWYRPKMVQQWKAEQTEATKNFVPLTEQEITQLEMEQQLKRINEDRKPDHLLGKRLRKDTGATEIERIHIQVKKESRRSKLHKPLVNLYY